MRYLLTALVFALTVAAGLHAPASAQSTAETITDALLTEAEKRVIREYYGVNTGWDEDGRSEDGGRDKPNPNGKAPKDKASKDKAKDKGGKSPPPGLAKRGDDLPPGLAKRETLPPGLEKRALPGDLKAKLPKRDLTEVVIAEDRVVLVEKATRKVLDILTDVIVDGTTGGGR